MPGARRSIDAESLAEITALFAPEFVEYRGGVFRADEFDRENVDTWFEQNQGDIPSVESVVNHVHLFDVVTDNYENDQPADLWAIALRLADVWRAVLTTRFPDRSFEVSCLVGYGPEVSFFQVRPGPEL